MIIITKFRVGVQLAKYPPGPFDESDDICLESMEPQMAEVKIEESVERLLSPASRSISFKLTSASKAMMMKKHSSVVVKILARFASVFHFFCLSH